MNFQQMYLLNIIPFSIYSFNELNINQYTRRTCFYDNLFLKIYFLKIPSSNEAEYEYNEFK